MGSLQKDVLVIGRFQPLCRHHVGIFRKAKEIGDRLFVVVGQPNLERANAVLTPNKRSHYQLSYRFPFKQVEEWIGKAGIGADAVVPVQDILSGEKYAIHVLEALKPYGVSKDRLVLVTENAWTADCFRAAGIEVQNPEVYPYHAADVRRELTVTGKSGRLAVDLTADDIMKIRKAERAKDRIKDEGVLLHDGFVQVVGVPHNGTTYEIVLSDNAVALMYVDQEDNVWFTRQYREGVQRAVLEFPAEMADKPGMSPLEHAVAGLREECGISIKPEQVHYVMTAESSGGTMSEMVDLFVAYGSHRKVGQKLDFSERIEVVSMKFDEAYAKIASGEIIGPKTVALLQWEKIRRLEGKTPEESLGTSKRGF